MRNAIAEQIAKILGGELDEATTAELKGGWLSVHNEHGHFLCQKNSHGSLEVS